MNFTEPFVIYHEVENPSGNYMYSSLTVYPASTIYYEDKLYDDDENGRGDFIEYSDEWEEIGTAYETINIAANAVRRYGYNEAYSDCADLSGGSAHVVHCDKNTKLSNSPTAKFTFTGTGFDIIASCGNETGSIIAYVYSGDTVADDSEPIAKLFVNTYHGYELVENGYYIHHWKFTEGRWKYVARTNSDTAISNTDFPRDAEEGSTMQTCEKRYTYKQTECDDIEQCNVLKRVGMDYGTYTVVLKTMYSEIFDHSSDGSGNYDVVLDAIRIYNPALDNASANERYASDGEDDVKVISLPDMLISAGSLGNADESGIVFIDGIGSVSDIEIYRKYASANEIYLNAGQSIGFALEDADNLVSAAVGVRAIENGDSCAKLKVNGSETDITSCTDMYYDITADIVGEDYVVISNSGQGRLALSTLKLKYQDAVLTQVEAPVYVNSAFVDKMVSEINAVYVEDNSEEAFDPKNFTEIYMLILKAGLICDVYFITSSEVANVKLAGSSAKLRFIDRMGYKHWQMELYFETGGVRIYPAIAIDKDGNASEAIECILNVEDKKVKIGIGGKLM